MLNSKQRSYLRGLASLTEAVYQIGKGGVSENMLKQLDDALTARELIKITVLRNAEDSAKGFVGELADKLNAEPVAAIGGKVILFRRSDKENIKHIVLPE